MALGAFDDLPSWLRPIARAVEQVSAQQLSSFLPPEDGSARASAVLLLFGEGPKGPDILMIGRARGMRSHAGQVAFPGGAVDPGDEGPVAAALREAEEETGLSPSGVTVFATLPDLWVPPSNFVVTPVLGWWHTPSAIGVVDPAEVESVHRVVLADLLDAGNRFMVRHPSGVLGPAFEIDGLFVWGFTAGLLSRLFELVGWELPWDRGRQRELPPNLVERSGTGSARLAEAAREPL